MEGAVILNGIGNEVFVTLCCGAIIIAIIAVLLTYTTMFGGASTETRNGSNVTPHHSYNTGPCPICISPHTLAVETNCGHKFCGACLRSYLNNRTPGDFPIFNRRRRCPLCRQDINILLLSFTQDEIESSTLEEDRNNIESTVHDYNIRFGVGPRSLWSYISDCPVLIRHLFHNFFSLRGVVLMFRVRVILCFLSALIYVGYPIDFIPEAMFGILGFLDDLVVFFLCAVYVSVLYRRFVINRGYSQ